MKNLLPILFFGFAMTISAQETTVTSEIHLKTTEDKMAYYEKRGAEDAHFELEFKAKSKDEEKIFWKEQEAYERNLKKQYRKEYHIYIASKKEVYATHHHHCDEHYHSDYFYQHAGYYYYGYDQYNYQPTSRSTSANMQIGVRVPSLSLGL